MPNKYHKDLVGSDLHINKAHASTHKSDGTDPLDALAPATHTTSHQAGGSDPIALDTLAEPIDIVNLNATVSAHGLCPKLGGGTSNYLRSDGSWNTPPTLGIRNVARNLVVKTNIANPTYRVDIDASEIMLQNISGVCYRATDIDLTIDIATSGANGLDTGTEANVWYYIWVICDGTTVAGLLSASGTAPTMPTGYTYKALAGYVKNTSGNFLNFTQIGDVYRHKSPILVVNNIGSDGSLPIDLSAVIPPGIKGVFGKIFLNDSTHVLFDNYDYDPNGSVNSFSNSVSMGVTASGPFDLPLLITDQSMFFSTSSDGAHTCYIWVSGFTLR